MAPAKKQPKRKGRKGLQAKAARNEPHKSTPSKASTTRSRPLVMAQTPQTPAPTSQAQAHQPGDLPSPHTFDTLPSLAALLSRLLVPSPGLAPPGTQETATSADADGHLDIQQLDAEANDVRVKIQKARTSVRALPDVDRSVEEQEAEIAELEARIGRMREMLGTVFGEGQKDN